MLELMRLLIEAIWKLLNIPVEVSEGIIIRGWHPWAFGLIVGLMLKFAFGGKKND